MLTVEISSRFKMLYLLQDIIIESTIKVLFSSKLYFNYIADI